MKFCIALLFLIFVISGEYNIYSNYLGDDCVDSKKVQIEFLRKKHICVKDLISIFTLANKRNSDKSLMI